MYFYTNYLSSSDLLFHSDEAERTDVLELPDLFLCPAEPVGGRDTKEADDTIVIWNLEDLIFAAAAGLDVAKHSGVFLADFLFLCDFGVKQLDSLHVLFLGFFLGLLVLTSSPHADALNAIALASFDGGGHELGVVELFCLENRRCDSVSEHKLNHAKPTAFLLPANLGQNQVA